MIKSAKTAPREGVSSRNGLPELVPYVYRQEGRRNGYAARIAQRNSQGPPQLPALMAGSDEVLRLAVQAASLRDWLGKA